MKKTITINYLENTIDLTPALYKKACIFGTREYEDLNAMMASHPSFKINFTRSDKKTYNGLSFAKMREYIGTQFSGKELEARLADLERVIKVASAKNGKYPLTKKWFLENYPEYKNAEISENEKKNPSSTNETKLKMIENNEVA